MPPRRLLRAFVLLWWTLGVALLFASVQTVRWAAHANHGAHSHLALLAGVEALGAVLFLIPRALRLGAALLLLTLAVAFGIHALRHEFRWDLLVYAAAVLFVAVHGSLTTSQWAEARAPSW